MARALVIGASGGIGAVISTVLRKSGTEVVGLSRSVDGLDVTDPRSVAHHLGGLPGKFDLIFVAVGILAPPGAAPEKSLAAIDGDAMQQVFAVNTVGPALILGSASRLLPKKGRSVVALLSARVGSIGDNRLGGWHSYRASKAALNQIVRGAAIELGRTHKEAICVALHPGTVTTSFTANYANRHAMVAPAAAAENLLRVIGSLKQDDSGGFYDYAGETVPW